MTRIEIINRAHHMVCELYGCDEIHRIPDGYLLIEEVDCGTTLEGDHEMVMAPIDWVSYEEFQSALSDAEETIINNLN